MWPSFHQSYEALVQVECRIQAQALFPTIPAPCLCAFLAENTIFHPLSASISQFDVESHPHFEIEPLYRSRQELNEWIKTRPHPSLHVHQTLPKLRVESYPPVDMQTDLPSRIVPP